MEISAVIKAGQIGVIPTDTIYGLVGSALLPETVRRIYTVRKRSKDKPFIVLISHISDLHLFGIVPEKKLLFFLEKNWPGKISVVIPVKDAAWSYLHRGKRSIAFRLPDKKELRELISVTGALVAPSANLEGKAPAKTITEAKEYFGDRVDFYVDGGMLKGEPSTLVEYRGGDILVVREGRVKPLL